MASYFTLGENQKFTRVKRIALVNALVNATEKTA